MLKATDGPALEEVRVDGKRRKEDSLSPKRWSPEQMLPPHLEHPPSTPPLPKVRAAGGARCTGRRYATLACAALLAPLVGSYAWLCWSLARRERLHRWRYRGGGEGGGVGASAQGEIPRIIHQMYRSAELPERWQHVPQAWKAQRQRLRRRGPVEAHQLSPDNRRASERPPAHAPRARAGAARRLSVHAVDGHGAARADRRRVPMAARHLRCVPARCGKELEPGASRRASTVLLARPGRRLIGTDTQRWDASRFAILHKYGGVYADLDVEAVERIDPLLAGPAGSKRRPPLDEDSAPSARPGAT